MPDASPGDQNIEVKRKHVGVQVNLDKSASYSFSIPKWLFWFCAIVVGIIAIYLGADYAISLTEPRWQVDSETMEDMGVDGVIMFRQYDRDNDGVLSLQEFEPIAHQVLEFNVTHVYDEPIEDQDEVITIESFFEPLKLDTMTKDLNETGGIMDPLTGIKSWKNQKEEWLNFGASHFRGFLPKEAPIFSSARESVGEVYKVVDPQVDGRGVHLSSNRYNPPRLVDLHETTLHRLLTMFHPRPFIYSRFAPQGTVATIRAYNDKFLHIVFRCHAEYQLNEPPFYPFWYTPAQFIGDLIIHRDDTKVLYFRMFVPNHNRLNVDMEWLDTSRDGQNMEVDIGYMPLMELKSVRASLPVMYGGEDQRDKRQEASEGYEKSIEMIKWTNEISRAEALRKLEVKMYPFKEVQYYNFTDVFPQAQKEQKPVHSILLWGALDDQSC